MTINAACVGFGRCGAPDKWHYTGDRYEETKGLDVRGVAALVREDLAAAGCRPPRVTVRIQRFAGGASIKIVVRRAQPPPETIEALNAALARYNYDHGDPLSDYSCVRFYGRVEVQP